MIVPLEIEAKYRVTSHDAVRAALRSHRASCAGRSLEINRIYDTPEGRLRRDGCGLRIRTWPSQGDGVPARAAQLTFKGPLHPGVLKIRDELEIEVSDADVTHAILVALDFSEQLRYRKTREIWRLADCEVALDDVPLLGLFVEIEGPDEQAVEALACELGLDPSQREPQTYIPLILEICRSRHLDPLSFGFVK